MEAATKQKERLQIPVRGKVQKKVGKTIPMFAPLKIRLKVNNRSK